MAVEHRRVITLMEPAPSFFNRAAEAVRLLGWNLGNPQPFKLYAKTKLTIWSWGEHIHVNQISNDHVEVISRSLLPTQIIDFGRHKKNVQSLLNMIDKVR